MIGEAHVLGRALAMQAAETNKPVGARYNKAMSAWLAEHGFDSMDKSDRSRLMECMDNREAIEPWRNTLTATERLQCNHPRVVLRKWKAATKQTKPKKRGKSWQEICNELDAENYRLKQELARLPELDALNHQLKQEITRIKTENARLLKQLWPDDWKLNAS